MDYAHHSSFCSKDLFCTLGEKKKQFTDNVAIFNCIYIGVVKSINLIWSLMKIAIIIDEFNLLILDFF